MLIKPGFAFYILIVAFPISAYSQSIKGALLTGSFAGEQFGRNVKLSVDGSVLAVAAPFYKVQGEKQGRISVYKYKANNWKMIGKEIPAGKGDFDYGELMELSADGKMLVVASPSKTISFYTIYDSSWMKEEKNILLHEYDMIHSISLAPNSLKIAVAFQNFKHFTNHIKIFSFNGNEWQQEGDELIPYPDEKVHGLSLTLSADANNLVVGNYSKDLKKNKNAGEIILYKRDDSIWKLQAQQLQGKFPDARLGKMVALSNSGTTMVAASSNIYETLYSSNAGFVETYELSGAEWIKKNATLKPEKPNAGFSHSISLSGDGKILAVSMPYIGYAKPGDVKLYKMDAAGWNEIAVIRDDNGVEATSLPNNSTGWSIALSADGKTLAVGFPHNDENGDMSGKVIVYDLSNLL